MKTNKSLLSDRNQHIPQGPFREGKILLEGEEIHKLDPHQIVKKG